LRQVTKRDAGDTYESWNAELPKLLKALPDLPKELPKSIQEPPSKKGEPGEKALKDGTGR
jgi:hypothetical protein